MAKETIAEILAKPYVQPDWNAHLPRPSDEAITEDRHRGILQYASFLIQYVADEVIAAVIEAMHEHNTSSNPPTGSPGSPSLEGNRGTSSGNQFPNGNHPAQNTP
jgi:hypothetical protein